MPVMGRGMGMPPNKMQRAVSPLPDNLPKGPRSDLAGVPTGPKSSRV